MSTTVVAPRVGEDAVVGDQQHAEAELLLEVRDGLQERGLGRDVEHR